MDILKKAPSPMNIDKKDIVDMLLREEYGYLPSRPHEVSATLEKREKRFCAGKAELQKIILRCRSDWGDFFFPVYYVFSKE